MSDLPHMWDNNLPDDPFPDDVFSEIPDFDVPDDMDALLHTAMELGGIVTELPAPPADDSAAFKALSEIGLEADGADLDRDPPPFFDPETNTAFWIGVFQPDVNDKECCIASILSLTRAENGDVDAQLAPCVPGDWDKAYGVCEYLLGVMERGGIEPCLDAAEGMALATDQRELWERERGIPLETDAAQGLADVARNEWHIEL